ncbi:MAG: YfhO family protein [Lachnospiraceae bacterium]|nr:YfhO family protein [Lachnospiraceae bacterium]
MKKKHPSYVILCAFLLSIAAFLLFLLFYDVLGFGNRTLLRGDLYAQYVDFIHLFLRVLKGEEDFWYTFSQYYGSPSILTYAYYAFSPFNLLYLPGIISIPAMTAVIISLKIGLCGASFSLFAKRVIRCSDRCAVFFAICYAMNSFNITLHFDIIWLESAYLLPILILLTHRLIRTGRWLALVPVWAFLFLSNFYMAFISGIFIATAFLAMLFLRPSSGDAEALPVWNLFLRFGSSVVLAAGCCAAILLPCAKFLLSHMAADNQSFSELPTSFLDVANSLMLGVMPDMDNRTPILYCGLPVLLLLIQYFLQKTIPVKERIVSGVLLFFNFLSMVFLPLFILMHAFDYPNFYFFRNSAFVCFLLCALACRCFSAAKGRFSPKSIWISIAGLICLYSFMSGFWPLYKQASDVTNSSSEMALNILFLSLWGIFLMPRFDLSSFKKRGRLLLTAICFILLIFELALNGGLAMKHMDFEPFPEKEYEYWYQAQKNVLDQIPPEEDQLCRISMYGDNNYNSSAMFAYSSFNTFSSSDQYELRNALYGLGISVSNRSITENGYTDLTYMLFDKGYTGDIRRIGEKTDERFSELKAFPWRLSIAYMVSDGIKAYQAGPDPFENQERLVKAISGKDYHFFDRMELEDLKLSSFNARIYSLGNYWVFSRYSSHSSNAGLYFSVPKDPDHPFYACFHQREPIALVTAPYILGSDEIYAENLTLAVGYIAKGGKVSDSFAPDTDNIAVYFNQDSMDEYYCDAMYFSRFDPTQLDSLHNDLLPGILTLSDWSSSRLKGTVTADEDHPILFTSIPWDEGWQAKVDGISTPCEPLMDHAFLSLSLSTGFHEIELDYVAPGAKSGRMVTIVCVLIYASLLILSRIVKKKQA